MSFTLHHGDALEVLRGLPDASINCCLELTPDGYVARLVDVFREVRRVLRDDGVLFLNLGDSYFGGGGFCPTAPSTATSKSGKYGRQGALIKGRTSARAQRVQSCDTSGKAESDFLSCGSVSESLDGERIDALCSRTSDICLHHATILARGFCLRIQARMAELNAHLPIEGYSDPRPTMQSLTAIQDSLRSAIRESSLVLSSRLSKTPESLQQHPAGFRLSDSFSAFLSTLRSFSSCAQWCVDMLDGLSSPPDDMAGNASPFEVLAHYIQCIGEYCLLVSSCLDIRKIEPQSSVILKQKDLIGIPWLVAFALRADGWYLRSEIIWHKPNPMPESVRDRPTKAHEQIFLLSKSPKYYYDADAVKEPNKWPDHNRFGNKNAAARNVSKLTGNMRPDAPEFTSRTGRNRRSVWTVTPKPYKEAHFATFPPDLIEPCILAGCPEGGTVLDPFGGSGTTAQVAIQNRRNAVLIELNANYIELINKRLEGVVPMSETEMPLFAELEGAA